MDSSDVVEIFSSLHNLSLISGLTPTSEYDVQLRSRESRADEADQQVEKSVMDCPGGSSCSSSSGSSGTASLSFQTKLAILYSKYPVAEWKSQGFFDDSLVHSIDEHWLQFDRPSSQLHISLAIIYTLIMCVGIFGNVLVIVMFARCRSLRTPANYLILNLALADGLLLAKIPIFLFNSIHGGPATGYIGCQLYGFVGGLMGTASIMTLMCIAIDRYYVIVFPLNPFKKTTHRRALVMIVLVWIYSTTFASLPFFLLNGYVPEGLLTSCSFDYLDSDVKTRIFVFMYFVAAWVVPVSLIIYSYASIFRMVVQTEQKFDKDVGRKSRKYDEKLRNELKIAMVATVIILLWTVAWTPYAIVALLGIFNQKHLITQLVSSIPALFCKTASAIDPFVYSISHPRFKRELLKTPLAVICLSAHRRGRRNNVSKETTSHYYSATCVAQSEDSQSQSQSQTRDTSRPITTRLTNRSSSGSNLNSCSHSHSYSNSNSTSVILNLKKASPNPNRLFYRRSSLVTYPNMKFPKFPSDEDESQVALSSACSEPSFLTSEAATADPTTVTASNNNNNNNRGASSLHSDFPKSQSNGSCTVTILLESRNPTISSQQNNNTDNNSNKESFGMKRVRICSQETIPDGIGVAARVGAGVGVGVEKGQQSPGVYSPTVSLGEIGSPTKSSLRSPQMRNSYHFKSPTEEETKTRNKRKGRKDEANSYKEIEFANPDISKSLETSFQSFSLRKSGSKQLMVKEEALTRDCDDEMTVASPSDSGKFTEDDNIENLYKTREFATYKSTMV